MERGSEGFCGCTWGERSEPCWGVDGSYEWEMDVGILSIARVSWDGF